MIEPLVVSLLRPFLVVYGRHLGFPSCYATINNISPLHHRHQDSQPGSSGEGVLTNPSSGERVRSIITELYFRPEGTVASVFVYLDGVDVIVHYNGRSLPGFMPLGNPIKFYQDLLSFADYVPTYLVSVLIVSRRHYI